MPARKPSSLINRHETAAEKRARSKRESSLRPARGLPVSEPARLKDHKIAAEAWRRIMRKYRQLEGEIVTGLDLDHLIDYCMLIEQLAQIDKMRQVAYQCWLELAAKHESVLEDEDESLDPDEKKDQLAYYATQVVGAFDAVTKLDTRAERKRALIKQYRESLYLTPRSRAGTAPAKKEPEEEPDELEKLLDDVTEYVNGPKE